MPTPDLMAGHHPATGKSQEKTFRKFSFDMTEGGPLDGFSLRGMKKNIVAHGFGAEDFRKFQETFLAIFFHDEGSFGGGSGGEEFSAMDPMEGYPQAGRLDRLKDIVDQILGKSSRRILGMGGQGHDHGGGGKSIQQIQAVLVSQGDIQKQQVHIFLNQKFLRGRQGNGFAQELHLGKRFQDLAEIGSAKGFILDEEGRQDFRIHAGKVRLAMT
jgi:hypothetical protein